MEKSSPFAKFVTSEPVQLKPQSAGKKGSPFEKFVKPEGALMTAGRYATQLPQAYLATTPPGIAPRLPWIEINHGGHIRPVGRQENIFDLGLFIVD